jgi:hypothetical protein
VTWPADTVERALALSREGATDREIAERLGPSPHTVRDWRRGRVPRRADERHPRCARCGDRHARAALAPSTYCYLLGLYLGDGCLTAHRRTYALRVTMDSAYPGIVEECRAAIARVLESERVAVTPSRRDRSVVISAYFRGWPCLFPQHGPGRKHRRPIVLERWQLTLVEADPGALLRGLIHSDGWRGTNRVTVKGRDYAYPRYQFSSRSDDIRTIFTDACDLLGIAWRPWGRWHVSVARRDAVARLDELVGPKF